MQPFEIVILFFCICLIHGIFRAIKDVREEAVKAFYVEQIQKAISKMTGLSEAFLGMAKSAKCANDSFRCFGEAVPIKFTEPNRGGERNQMRKNMEII